MIGHAQIVKLVGPGTILVLRRHIVFQPVYGREFTRGEPDVGIRHRQPVAIVVTIRVPENVVTITENPRQQQTLIHFKHPKRVLGRAVQIKIDRARKSDTVCLTDLSVNRARNTRFSVLSCPWDTAHRRM